MRGKAYTTVMTIALATCLMLGVVPVVSQSVDIGLKTSWVPHAPIRIDSNADFPGIASSGNGSVGNPWIIEGWDINGTGFGYCIYIGNTTDYHTVRDCYVYKADGYYSSPFFLESGLLLYNVQNSTYTNNTATLNNLDGIYLWDSDNNTLSNNTAFSNNQSGINLHSSSNCTLSNNTASSNFDRGIKLSDSNNNTFFNNTVLNNCYGFQLYNSNNNTLTINTASSNTGRGINVISSSNNTLTKNKASSNGDSGLCLYSSSNNTLSNNTASSNNDYGIYLEDSGGNTLGYNIASNNDYGVSLLYSDRNTLSYNIGSSNSIYGLYLHSSSNNTLKKNTASNNDYGIYLRSFSNNNTLTNNTVSLFNDRGIYLWDSYFNTLSYNTAISCNFYGLYLFNSDHNILSYNSAANNEYGLYLNSASNNTLTNNDVWNNEGGIYIRQDSNDNTLTDNDASSNDNGIDIYSCDSNSLIDNKALYNDYSGINVRESDYNLIKSNNASSNSYTGLNFWLSDGNTLINNTASLNTNYGIYLGVSNSNIFMNNNMTSDGIVIIGNQLSNWNTHFIDTTNVVNGKPVRYWKNQTGGIVPSGAGQVILANCTGVTVENQNLSGGSNGLGLAYSSNCILNNNTAFSNKWRGFYLESSHNNLLTNNTLSSNNQMGLWITGSVSNLIYHNYFINNTSQATCDGNINFWDNGYPSGGNYWSDYSGIDILGGSAQDLPGPDGIGDIPYSTGGGGQVDNYPLMTPGDIVDTFPPASEVDQINPHWYNSSPMQITASANDRNNTVTSVELFYSYEGIAWTSFGVDNAVPWEWNFNWPDGEGNYTFYTIATDSNTDVEPAPAIEDEDAGYDLTPPTSTVNPVTSYMSNKTPLNLTATAVDYLSGILSMELFYRYSADNSTWNSWMSFGVDNAAQWQWNFSFPDGEGYYEFYTIATDASNNEEPSPGIRDETIGYDVTSPTSTVNPVTPFWYEETSLALTATTNDIVSGVLNLELFYRYSPENATWSNWTSYTIDNVEPWEWSFNFLRGEGYYEFYTIATDNVGNIENATGIKDTTCGYDLGPPLIIDNSSATSTTGETYSFNFNVNDYNITAVYVIYQFGTASETNITAISVSSDEYTLNITIPLNSTDPLHYRLVALDHSGKWNSTTVKSVSIVDNDDPIANAGSNQTVTDGSIVMFNGSGSSDNIGLANYSWTFNDGIDNVITYGVAPSHNFRIAGNYTVILTVSDFAGNNITDTVVINVFLDTDNDGDPDDNDLDDDNDGTPDIEDDFPLDPTEDTDSDGDGIGNNADPDDDNDGIPDEVDDEPLIPNTDGGGIGSYWWVLIVVILVAVLSFLYLQRRKKGPENEEE